jgi:hypothetical protein
MPVAIAEVGIPGLAVTSPSGPFDSGCRTDLVSIDGEAVPVRVTGDVERAVRRDALDLVGCEGPVAVGLEAGDHVLRTEPGRTTGIDVDRLLLGSEAGGAALAADALPRTLPAGPPATIDADGRVSVDATVDGDGSPFWLVLGQSWSDGWTARADGDDLGPPVLIDGFANGWLVEPTAPGPVAVTMAWSPQRIVWGAIAVSAVAAVGCLGLMLAGRRGAPRHLAVTAGRDLPDEPTLEWPPLGVAPSVPWTLAVPLLAGLAVLGALATPTGLPLLVLVPVGGVAVAGLRWRRGRSLPSLAAAASLALAGAFVVVQQYRHRFPPDFVWPTEFDRVHVLGVAVVLLSAAQVLRDLADRRGDATPSPVDPAGNRDAPAAGAPAASPPAAPGARS